MENLDNLADFDETHAEIFYSNPYKVEDNFMYQYRITVVNDVFELDIVKSIDNEEVVNEDEDEALDYDIILLKNIVNMDLVEAKEKIKNKIDLRIDGHKTIFEKDDELSELYNELI
tara:strand:+ start:370 stop:717 length:348 start_codon:yes stop_codon:yes gene_type:complete